MEVQEPGWAGSWRPKVESLGLAETKRVLSLKGEGENGALVAAFRLPLALQGEGAGG